MIRITQMVMPGIGYCDGCGSIVDARKDEKDNWLISGHIYTFGPSGGPGLSFHLCWRCEEEIDRIKANQREAHAFTRSDGEKQG